METDLNKGDYLKVLLISHNVFDYTSSMGKTLSKIFETFGRDEIAQLYIHPEDPGPMPFCSNYYRVTDGEAIKSIIRRNRIGESFKYDNFEEIQPSKPNVDISGIYQSGRRRTPLIYIARDTVWKISNWKNKKLEDWVLSFNPDVVFLASGDYKFIYEIALYLANLFNKPLVTSCFDDYYIFNKNENSFLGRVRHKSFMRLVHKIMKRSSSIITVCEPMAKAYGAIFSKPTHVLYTSAEQETIKYNVDGEKLAYFGSLGLSRDDQLVAIGKCFKAITGRNIDVYSSEIRPNVINKLVVENGINFHKAVSPVEMKKIYSECMGVIHTESFDLKTLGRTRFSVSTKIAESLAYGPCLFAYGPKEQAGFEYLIKNKAALVVTDPVYLESGLKNFIYDKENRKKIILRARNVAKENHNIRINGEKVRTWLREAINSYRI